MFLRSRRRIFTIGFLALAALGVTFLNYENQARQQRLLLREKIQQVQELSLEFNRAVRPPLQWDRLERPHPLDEQRDYTRMPDHGIA